MNINEVLVFKIKGKFGHFKKFYSNKSSLTYKIPTRTVLMGMVASILEYSRDEYYQIFSIENVKFGIKILKPGLPHFECMNYLKEDSSHTQVRLQLLLAKNNSIEYQVYFAHQDSAINSKLEKKLINGNLGYGLYLGQRQYRATTQFVKKVKQNNIEVFNDFMGELSTLTYKANIKKLELEENTQLVVDNMPITFTKLTYGREPASMGEFCFEESGKNIKGEFTEVIKLNNEYISFFTPVEEN